MNEHERLFRSVVCSAWSPNAEQQAYRKLRNETQMRLLDKLGIPDNAWAGLITLNLALLDGDSKRFEGRPYLDAVSESVPDGSALMNATCELSGAGYSRVQVRVGGSLLAPRVSFKCKDEAGWPRAYMLGLWNRPRGGELVFMLPIDWSIPAHIGYDDELRLDLNIGT